MIFDRASLVMISGNLDLGVHLESNQVERLRSGKGVTGPTATIPIIFLSSIFTIGLDINHRTLRQVRSQFTQI